MNWIFAKAWPPSLDVAQGGSPQGSYRVTLPASSKEVAECDRDFARTYVRGGRIAVVTPTTFRDKLEPVADLREVLSGDMSVAAVKTVVADFRDQMTASIRQFVEDEDDYALLNQSVASGVLLANLSIGPALDFSIHVGVPPRILQTKFVVMLGPQSVRVATFGFVGEPWIGDDPSKQATPFMVRIISENLVGVTDSSVVLSYHVREVDPTTTSMEDLVAADVHILRQVALCGDGVLDEDGGLAPLPSLTVSIALPREGINEEDGTSYFMVEIAPLEGGLPWSVNKRYGDFRVLKTMVSPFLGNSIAAEFPRRHLRHCTGHKLEARRTKLETWLRHVLRAAHTDANECLRPLCRFLEAQEHVKRVLKVQQVGEILVGFPQQSKEEDVDSCTTTPIMTVADFLDAGALELK